jgi:hypothetical protein
MIIGNELLETSTKQTGEREPRDEHGAFKTNEAGVRLHREPYSTDWGGSCSGQVKELSKKRHGRVDRKKFSSKTSPLACLRASARSVVLPTSRILSVFRSTFLRRSFSSLTESLSEKLHPLEEE